MITFLLVNSFAVFISASILDGIKIKNYWTALGFAIVLAIINLIIKPVIVFLTIPLTIITLGLFILVINAWMIMLSGKIIEGISIKNFWWALLFGIIISLINGILLRIF